MQVDLDPGGHASPMDDAMICELLKTHLNISDAAALFRQSDSDAASRPQATAPRKAARPAAPPSKEQPSLEGFVALTRELIELEREAEVQQATEYTLLRSPERAQVR